MSEVQRWSGGALMRVAIYTHLTGLIAGASASYADRHGLQSLPFEVLGLWGLITLCCCPIGELFLVQSKRLDAKQGMVLVFLAGALEFSEWTAILPLVQ